MNTGIAVGNRGTILHTSDGGTTWITKGSNITARLNAITFANASTGIAVGAEGIILRTTDGGETWTRQESSTNFTIYGVDFANTHVGTAVGAFGTILRTTDGGVTWQDQSIFLSGEYLFAVSTPNPNLAVAVGGVLSATIAVTSDGGNTWNSFTADSLSALYGILVLSDGPGNPRGLAVGENGTILSTFDGGNTWLLQTSPTNSILREAFFVDDPSTNGIVVAEDGFTLRLERP
jgi:photosystem II stability/assembly factor-like uncharacterized protein